MYKLAEKLIVGRYYKLSQDNTLPGMKLVEIGTSNALFNFMGTHRNYPLIDLHDRIKHNRIWIMRDQYRELIVKFSILMACEVEEDFDDNEIPQYLKEMAHAAIELVSNWYCEPSLVQQIDNINVPF